MPRGRKPNEAAVEVEVKGVSCKRGIWRFRYYMEGDRKEVYIGKEVRVLHDETTVGMTLQSVLNDFASKINRLNECRKLWVKTDTLHYQDDLIAFIDRLRRFHHGIYNTLVGHGLLIGDIKKSVDRMMTVEQLIENFYAEKEFTPQTRKTYRLAFSELGEKIKNKPVILVTKDDLSEVVARIKGCRKRQTAEKRFGQIKALLKYGAKIKLISNDSDLFDVELKYSGQEKAEARKKETPKKIISVRTFNQIIEALKSRKKCKMSPVKSQQYVGIFTFIRFFGLRVVSELHGMKWEHIHDEMITIYSPKTAHREASERSCPVFQEVRDFLSEWEPICKQHFPESPYIFPDYFNISRNTIEKKLEVILSNFEITETVKGEERRIVETWKKPFNSFRATRVTELIEEIGIFEACCFLGHKPTTALEKCHERLFYGR